MGGERRVRDAVRRWENGKATLSFKNHPQISRMAQIRKEPEPMNEQDVFIDSAIPEQPDLELHRKSDHRRIHHGEQSGDRFQVEVKSISHGRLCKL